MMYLNIEPTKRVGVDPCKCVDLWLTVPIDQVHLFVKALAHVAQTDPMELE